MNTTILGRSRRLAQHPAIQWLGTTLLFLAVSMALFAPALPQDRVLLPVDSLYQFQPWSAAARDLGVIAPANPLVSDTILQNYGWKRFAAQQWWRGEAPLWNPYILGGQPFLATGQNASLYPLGLIFSVIPVADAYEVFAIVHFTLAGVFTVALLRTLRAGWLGGIVAGLTFSMCGFLVVSVVWPMMVSTAVWLPLLLRSIERFLQARSGSRSRLGWLVLGVFVVALQFLAGHLEISFYILATAGLYTALRLLASLPSAPLVSLGRGVALLVMVMAGALLASVQIVPFVEAISHNVRVGQVTYSDVQSYAFDRGQWWAFMLPDFFGNPTHRTFLDATSGAVESAEHVRVAADGSTEFRRDTEWGRRNYVEGTAYVGIAPLILAPIGAIIGWRRAWPFAVIAGIALLCAFGTPLYALIFYGLPGGNQVHTPFRWVYPWSLCIAVLAGLGVDALRGNLDRLWQRRAISSVVAVAGAAGVLVLATTTWFWVELRESTSSLDPLLRRLGDYRAGFESSQAFLSYLLPQFVVLAGLLLATAAIVWLATNRRAALPGILLAMLVAVDLGSFGVGFNPASERRLLDYEPSAITFLRTQPGPFRIAVLGPEDVLPANLGMIFDIQDIRGYDTIIDRDYVDYLDLIERPGALLYSKVEKLFDAGSLTTPQFQLLNARYILTSNPIEKPGLVPVFDQGVLIYRNDRALPRAFVPARAVTVESRDAALGLLHQPGYDPASLAVLEDLPADFRLDVVDAAVGTVAVNEYEPDHIVMRVSVDRNAVVVIGDAFAPGWIAEVDGQSAPVLRADRAFRAVAVPAGEHDLRLQYRPFSVRLGLLLSALGLIMVAAMVMIPVWLGRRDSVADTSPFARLLRNVTAPFAGNLISRALDLGLALVMFRLLGPAGIGAYTFAIVLTGYLDILVGFGLTTLITRDVARHPERMATYFGNSLLVRAGFWTVAALIAWIIVAPLGSTLEISSDLALALGLLVIGLLPSSVSGSVSALLQGRERFDVPAAVMVTSALSKVILGIGVLLAGFGFVGLAGVSIVTNIGSVLLLIVIARQTIGLPWPRLDRPRLPELVRNAYPLMLSQVLNAVFFRIDALVLKPLAGDLALGWYSTAYRLIDAFQIIPSSIVLALFPMLSRHADDREATTRSTGLALRALLIIAFPIAVGCTILAEPIILAFAGAGYVPQSVIALQILIWYLPVSFTNGLVQYVLIARGRQRVLTAAFLIGVVFNLGANALLIPRFGYIAAACITVTSELVLFVPFWRALRQEGVHPSLTVAALRPALAAFVMAGALVLLGPLGWIAAAMLGGLVYLAALLTFGGVTRDELRSILRATGRFKR